VTATATASPPRARWNRWSRSKASTSERLEAPPTSSFEQSSSVPPLSPGKQLARAALIIVFIMAFTLVLQLVLIGSFQQTSAQERKFDSFRSDLANGTAPIGPTDSETRELAIGTPVAYIEIPEIGLRQVVVEGTTPSALFSGPGHRRDTPLPGQIGASVIMGRHAAFGGPFSKIDQLEADDLITVTTGQGVFEYVVIGVRREGDPIPSPAEPGTGRLLLATADGRPFLPDGVLRIDAELSEGAVVGAPRIYTPNTLPAAERLMGADTSTLWALALWIQGLILLSVGAVWAWHRWGHAQAWIVFLPPLLLVGLATSGEVARLLPNLL